MGFLSNSYSRPRYSRTGWEIEIHCGERKEWNETKRMIESDDLMS
jgi:hypothetical protein